MELHILRSKKELTEYWQWLNSQPLPVKVLTQRMELQRTIDQNSYLFGVVYKTISDYTGHTVDEIHEFYKDRFNFEYSLNPRTGEFELRYKSSTEETTASMGEFIDKVVSHAVNELGIGIPEANEVFYNDEVNFKKNVRRSVAKAD